LLVQSKNYQSVTMREFDFGSWSIKLSDKALQCKWCDFVLVDCAGTLYEDQDWVEAFANAKTETDAIKIFNAQFHDEWQMTKNHSVMELTTHSWIERKSIADFFRYYIVVGVLIFFSKDETPDLSFDSFDDINYHYVGKDNLMHLKRTKKGFYLLSMGIGYTPIDRDSQYLYKVMDSAGKTVLPFTVDGPWNGITRELERVGYM